MEHDLTACSPTTDTRSLPDTVAGVLDGYHGELPVLLDAAAASTADRAALTHWLSGFAEPAAAELVAARSYWHHNGFAKLVLHAADEFRIRMHVWQAGEGRLGETNPHGHRWNFASTVLCGDGLETEEYQESAHGKRHVRYCYLGGLNSLAPLKQVRLETTATKAIHAGERHAVHTEIVHTVHPMGTDLVATFVVQSRALTQNAPVYCVPGKAVDEPIVAITPAEVRHLVRSVLAAMEDRG